MKKPKIIWAVILSLMTNGLCSMEQLPDQISSNLPPQIIACVCDQKSYIIFDAGEKGCCACCIKFLEGNVNDINDFDTGCWTVLQHAAHKGYPEVVKILVTNGADINKKNKDGENALHIAAGWGHKQIVEFLLIKGVSIFDQNNDQETALHIAVRWSCLEVVKLIVNLPFSHAQQTNVAEKFQMLCNLSDTFQQEVKLLLLILKKLKITNTATAYNVPKGVLFIILNNLFNAQEFVKKLIMMNNKDNQNALHLATTDEIKQELEKYNF